MSYHSGKDISETKLEDYEYKYYNDLKKSCPKVKFSDSVYRCQYCPGQKNQDYLFKELIQHASGVGDSKSRGIKERAKHLALGRYLDGDVHPEPATKTEYPMPDGDEEFVYPWKCIIANIKTECKDGKHVAESGSRLEEDLLRKGFNPVKSSSPMESWGSFRNKKDAAGYTHHFENVLMHLEAKKKRLEQFEEQLRQREAQNETERRKLHDEKKHEPKRADEKVLTLAAEQKREKENLHRKIIELEKKLDAKQALELEVEAMRGALQVMKHMGDDGDMEVKTKMDEIGKDLNEKEEELAHMEELNQTLIVKERKTNDELQEARKELINGLREVTARANIGIKIMGELDTKPFFAATKRKFSKEEEDVKAVEQCSQWEDYLRDPSWHPFKIIVDKAGNAKHGAVVAADHDCVVTVVVGTVVDCWHLNLLEVVDEEDEKIKNLKNEFDEAGSDTLMR
ncbi:hypothetical protein CJ030_MR1G006675 [Morella rubra]|uniref:Factor of DNA methylation 1-5/IDN2 domain-containing protein n=1 Tax=Morella rubra TaxID=262757 RepID=A0A6A1WQ51_9ROSI|nr:hypothetical protein CJ030_MR1G006675 [Morella rubra]